MKKILCLFLIAAMLLVKDAALAEKIAGMESAKFLFDHQNVIVCIVDEM